MGNHQQVPTTFSEPEVQRILARAAELEGTFGTHFTVEDLRQVALKAGIDSHALDRAISEARGVDVPGEPLATPSGMQSTVIAGLAVTGAVLGALAIGADNLQPLGNSVIPVFAPSGLYAIYWALRHPVRKGFGPLLRELGVLFGSFTLAVTAIEGFKGASVAVTWSLMAGALACAVLSLRGARGPFTDATAVDAR